MCIRDRDGGGEEKPFAGVTLTLLNFSSATPGGVLTATCAVAEEKFGFRIEIEPVSYTHLDVYKRQVLPEARQMHPAQNREGHRTESQA